MRAGWRLPLCGLMAVALGESARADFAGPVSVSADAAARLAGTWYWQCCSGSSVGTLTIALAKGPPDELGRYSLTGSFHSGGSREPIAGWVRGRDVHFVRRLENRRTQTYDLTLLPGCGVMVGALLGDRELAIGSDFRAISRESATDCEERRTTLRLLRDSRGGPELLAGFSDGSAPSGKVLAGAADSAPPRRDAAKGAGPDRSSDGRCYYTTAVRRRCTGVPYDTRLDTEVDRVCNGCLTDAHCRERRGGRCINTPGGACGHDSKVCTYPGEPCYTASNHNLGGACGGGVCLNIDGRAACGSFPTSPPSAPRGPVGPR